MGIRSKTYISARDPGNNTLMPAKGACPVTNQLVMGITHRCGKAPTWALFRLRGWRCRIHENQVKRLVLFWLDAFADVPAAQRRVARGLPK